MRRTLLSRSAAIFFIRAFPAAAMAAVIIGFSHRIAPALNGIYQQLWAYLAVLLSVAAMGLPAFLLTHTSESIHSWLKTLQWRYAAWFGLWLILLSAVLVIIFPHSATVNPFIIIALFTGQVCLLLAETYLIINRKFMFTATVSFLYAVLFCVPHYLLITGRLSLQQLLAAIAVLGWVRAAALALAGRRLYAREAAATELRKMPYAVQQQWLQLGIYDVSQIIFRWIDKVIVAWIVGPALFAMYITGTTDVPLMPLMLGAAGSALLQQMASANVKEGYGERLALSRFSGTVLACIVFPLFFFLYFFRYEFVAVVFSSRYLPAVPLFAISILALPLRAYNYTSILQHMGKVKLINWGALLDICIALGLSYVLFPWENLSGVAFAFMISSYIQAIFYLVKTAQLLRCSVLQLIPWKQWLVMLIVFGCLGIGLHEMLARFCSVRQSLLLGFAATVMIIGIGSVPIIFTRKKHG
jgi:O-antigen/teichoic acid export membrane protein